MVNGPAPQPEYVYLKLSRNNTVFNKECFVQMLLVHVTVNYFQKVAAERQRPEVLLGVHTWHHLLELWLHFAGRQGPKRPLQLVRETKIFFETKLQWAMTKGDALNK